MGIKRKGQIEIMWLFVIFLVILAVGFIFSLLIGVVNWGSKIVTPVAENIGMVGNVNASDVGRMTFGVLNTLIGMLPMLVGFGYIIILVGCIGLTISYRGTQNPLFIGLFFAFMVLMIITAILCSNAYQDLYQGTDEIALELQSQTILSYLILYSPMIFGIIGFVCGIFLFSGRQNESYGVVG